MKPDTSIRDERDLSANGDAPATDVDLDVSEQLTRDRLNDIRNARQQVAQVRLNGVISVLDGDLMKEQANQAYKEALQSYLLELDPYRQTSQGEAAYWQGDSENPIGSVVIRPPARNAPQWTEQQSSAPAGQEHSALQPVEVYRVQGLSDVLAAPEVFEYTFRCTEHTRAFSNVTRVATVQRSFPRGVLDEAFKQANRYANGIGLDLDVDPDDHKSEGAGL